MLPFDRLFELPFDRPSELLAVVCDLDELELFCGFDAC